MCFVCAVVLGGLYSVTACTLGQIRQEDGPLNHFAAGLTVGAAIASKCKYFCMKSHRMQLNIISNDPIQCSILKSKNVL